MRTGLCGIVGAKQRSVKECSRAVIIKGKKGRGREKVEKNFED